MKNLTAPPRVSQNVSRETYVCGIILIFVIILSILLSACSPSGKLPKRPELDDSIPLMNGLQITNNLAQNPDRGLRYEFSMTPNEADTEGWAHPADLDENGKHVTAYDAGKAVRDLFRNAFNPPAEYNIAQLNVYLTEYFDKDLTQKALNQIKAYFEVLQNSDIRVMLKFCYRGGGAETASQEIISRHMSQLQEYFVTLKAWTVRVDSKNVHYALQDVVFAFLADDLTVSHISATVPEGYQIQVTDASLRDALPAKERLNVVLSADAVLPESGYIDGKTFIKSLSENRYSSLSAMQNFIERTADGSLGNHSMNRWKTEYITENDLISSDAPVNPGYFKNENGETIQRSVFDYVSDHLGYQLAASNLTVDDRATKEAGVSLSTIQFTISNFGAAAPLTLSTFEVVFATKDDKGNVIIYDKNNKNFAAFHKDKVMPNWKPLQLSAYGQIKVILPDFERDTGFAVGIRITAGRNAYVRLANDVPFYNGVNFIYDYAQLGL